jgi:hypothetical protein
MNCPHSAWLDLFVDPSIGLGTGPALLQFNRLQALIDAGVFSKPEKKTPCLITCIGSKAKNRFVQTVTGQRNSKSARVYPRAKVHLHISKVNVDDNSPLLVADYTTSNFRTANWTQDNCHEIVPRALLWARPENSVSEYILSRVLYPFTAAFCMFSLDLGGLRGSIDFLKTWMSYAQDCLEHDLSHPGVVIIITEGGGSAYPEWDLVETQLAQQIYGRSDIIIDVLRVPRGYRRLLPLIMPTLEKVQKLREKNRVLLSLDHFSALFNSACAHLSKNVMDPFDMIAATRMANPVSLSLNEHIRRFLSLLSDEYHIVHTGLQVVASSLVLDSLPPGMHGR